MDNQVLAALLTLYFASDSTKKQEASKWLEEFQKKPEAWLAADQLLNAEGAQLEFQAFGAQTIRNKITYDLLQLDAHAQSSLRDALLHLLVSKYARGPKLISTHLCLALSGLALQMDQWPNAFRHVVDLFRPHPGLLLEFLVVLPEEVRSNSRITAPEEKLEAFSLRANVLLTENADEVLQILMGMLQSCGSDTNIQTAVFRCLISWIKSNDISIQHLSQHPVVDIAFQALRSEDLMELASDVLCQVIREASNLEQAYPLAESIILRLEQTMDMLVACKKEGHEEEQRALCRIFVEAGESFLPLAKASHPKFPLIVRGILECTSFTDLDVVPITFNFWYELTQILTDMTDLRPIYMDAYRSLVEVMIRHLRYPADDHVMTAEERDEFREFRHIMGDVLKDCCLVLGDQEALSRPFNMIVSYLSAKPIKATWQEIEAPLFSLRSMGSEISDKEDVMLPQIMMLIPNLPEHPKLRYAATLVIGRYSSWTRNHPSFIPQQLQYISVGFNHEEVSAAAALSLKYLCESCQELMIDYLETLHPFYMTALTKLQKYDAMELTEAIAHIVKAVPLDQLFHVLSSFCQPIAQRLQELSAMNFSANDDKSEAIKELEIYLDRLNVFFKFVRPKVEASMEHPCVKLLQQLWPIFEALIQQYGGTISSESLCKCFKNAIVNFEVHMLSLLPALIALLAQAFQKWGQPCYLWVASHVVHKFGKLQDPSLRSSLQSLLDVACVTSFKLLDSPEKLNSNPDLVEDLFHLLSTYCKIMPDILFASPHLTSLLQLSISALDYHQAEGVERVLWWIRDVLQSGLNDEMKPSAYFAGIQQLGQSIGVILCSTILHGITGTGPTGIPMSVKNYRPAASVLLYLCIVVSFETAQNYLVSALNTLDSNKITAQAKTQFLELCHGATAENKLEKLRYALANLAAAYRGKPKPRENRRILEL